MCVCLFYGPVYTVALIPILKKYKELKALAPDGSYAKCYVNPDESRFTAKRRQWTKPLNEVMQTLFQIINIKILMILEEAVDFLEDLQHQ